MPYLFTLLFSSLILLMFKMANLSIRLSDSNVYFYTAVQMMKGKLLYKDIFFTNFPGFPYISVFYAFISGGSLEFFYATATVEAILTAFVLFFILKHQLKNERTALLGSLLYLFSFIILSTTDHQTGVFLVALFGTVSYYFFITKKHFLAGIFIGIALCIKAYFLPVAAAFFVYSIWKERKIFFHLFAGFIVSIALILLPTFILSPHDFIRNLSYSLTRSQGLPKLPILTFFAKHDLVLLGFFLYSFSLIRKNPLLFLISFFSFIFILYYKDMYYLYLNFCVPFLIVASGEFYKNHLQKKENVQTALVIIVVCISLINCYWYISSYSQLGKVNDFDSIVQLVKIANPTYIYGEEELATAVAYKADTPMLRGIVDTNANIFRKKLLNADFLTQKAIHSKTIIIARGAEYPELNIPKQIVSEIMDVATIKKHCQELSSFPVQAEGELNKVIILKCY